MTEKTQNDLLVISQEIIFEMSKGNTIPLQKRMADCFTLLLSDYAAELRGKILREYLSIYKPTLITQCRLYVSYSRGPLCIILGTTTSERGVSHVQATWYKETKSSPELLYLALYAGSLNETEKSVIFKKQIDYPLIITDRDKCMWQVLVSDILYIRSSRNYVHVYTSKRMIEVRDSTRHFLSLLPEQFLLVKRGFCINVRHIMILNTDSVVLSDHTEIKISRRIHSRLMRQLNEI